MTLSSKHSQDGIVAFFPDIDKINMLVATDFEEHLNQLIQEAKSQVVLDLSNIRFIDSSGFQALKKVKSNFNNRPLYIRNANQDIKELFELLKLEKEFQFIEN